MNVKTTAWTLWVMMTVGSSCFFAYNMALEGENSNLFLPGKTTHAHHQIEMSCSTCHTKLNTIKEDACIKCHGEDLEKHNDSHPKRKFTDPRNADRLAKLDASNCLTCHKEHLDVHTNEMAVTVPDDYCFKCHEDIADDRPSHIGMTFDTCATAGCHNYHDNSALYEDFLLKHANEPSILTSFNLLKREEKDDKSKALKASDADFSSFKGKTKSGVIELWSDSAHAQQGINCSDCHNQKGDWEEKPKLENCKECHSTEVKGFLEGFHGMRLAVNLPAMKPRMAQIPMHESAAHKKLDCASCHTSHSFNREDASYKACIQCHNDQHTNMYTNSKHFQLWIDKGFNGGVSCATCHLPRLESEDTNKHYFVQHNQNDNLRPNEKMIRSVCMNCHGLEFSIDALADKELVQRNFIGLPSRHIESIDMAEARHEK